MLSNRIEVEDEDDWGSGKRQRENNRMLGLASAVTGLFRDSRGKYLSVLRVIVNAAFMGMILLIHFAAEPILRNMST